LTAGAAPQRVRLLGEADRAAQPPVPGTTVGGLSSIDRDPWTGEYVLTSDDRSAIGPARFYTAKIDVDVNGIHDVRFTGTHPYLRPDGKTYPPLKECLATPCSQADATVDPEELRVDPWTGNITWSQEGERIVPNTLFDPSIRQARPRRQLYRPAPVARQRAHQRAAGRPEAEPDAGGIHLRRRRHAAGQCAGGSAASGRPQPSATAGALSRITVQDQVRPPARAVRVSAGTAVRHAEAADQH